MSVTVTVLVGSETPWGGLETLGTIVS